MGLISDRRKSRRNREARSISLEEAQSLTGYSKQLEIKKAQEELAQDIQNKVNPILTEKEVGTGQYGKTILDIQSGNVQSKEGFSTIGNEVFVGKSADIYIEAQKQEQKQLDIAQAQQQVKSDILLHRYKADETPTETILMKQTQPFQYSATYKPVQVYVQSKESKQFYPTESVMDKQTIEDTYGFRKGSQLNYDIQSEQDYASLSGLPASQFIYGATVDTVGSIVFHPIKTITSPFVLGGAVVTSPFSSESRNYLKETGKYIVNNPFRFGGQIAGGIVLGKVGGKALKKVIPEKQVGLKASEFDILKVVRKGKDGKLFTETQVIFKDVELGKPQTKWFWQKPIEVKKNIYYEGTRTTNQLYTDYGYTKTQAAEVGKININGNKIKLPKSPDVTEISKPESVIDISPSYNPTTRQGITLVGKTNPIRQRVSIQQYLKTRKAYTQERIQSMDLIVTNRKPYTTEVVGVTKRINIPESIKPKTKVLGTRLYKSGKTETGILQADILTSGKIVKRPVKPKADIFIKKSINNKRDVNTIFEKSKPQENIFKQPETKSRQQVITETITKSEQKAITKPKKVTFAVETKPMFKVPQVLVMPQLERQNFLGANQNSIMFGKLNLNQKSDNRYASMYKQNNKLDTALNTRFNFKSTQVPIQQIKQIPIQQTIIGLESRQRQDTQQIQMLRQEVITKPVSSMFQESVVVKYKFPLVLPIFQMPSQKNTSGKEQGYNVYMKEYGKRVKANTEPLPRKEAERLGMDIADNSLSASFIVTKVNQNVPSARRSNMAQGFGDASKFMFSKKRTGWVNERNRNRLDTFGEKQGITASKLIAQRKGNMFSSNSKNIFKKVM
jgi:hypothetical protein